MRSVAINKVRFKSGFIDLFVAKDMYRGRERRGRKRRGRVT
jgi:hypothetical protein